MQLKTFAVRRSGNHVYTKTRRVDPCCKGGRLHPQDRLLRLDYRVALGALTCRRPRRGGVWVFHDTADARGHRADHADRTESWFHL